MSGTVSALSMVFMGISALVCFSIPVVLFIFFKKKGADILPFFIGCGVFFVFALVLESLMHQLVLLVLPIGKTIQNNIWLYALYGGLAAGVFEEVGRLVAFKTVLKSKLGKNVNALMYGAGHGGFEAAFVVGVTMITNIVLSVIINVGGAEALISTAPAESVSQMEVMLSKLTDTPAVDYLLGIAERFLAVAMHISLSALLWLWVKNKKSFMVIAVVAIHALADGVLVICASFLPILATEAILAAITAAIVAFAVFTWKRYAKAEAAEQSE